MITLNNNTLAAAATSNPEFQFVAALLKLLSDPEAYQKQFEDLVAQTANRNVAAQEAKDAIEKLAADTAEAEKNIQAQRNKNVEEGQKRQREIDNALTEFQQRVEQNDLRTAQLDERDQKLTAREEAVRRREAAFAAHAAAIAGA